MYDKGKGVPQDYAQAVEWYIKAANQGFARAQYNLGVMCDKGQGVRQDSSISKKWFGEACDNGLLAGCDRYKQLNLQVH